MATQVINTINRNGANLDSLAVAADVGLAEKWLSTGNEFLYVFNGGGASVTVTLQYQTTTDGQTITNRVITIAAAEHVLIGPFPQNFYEDTNGYVNIAWSSATSVKLAVLKLGS